MARYLITGGAGFIGSHLVDVLIAGGHEVVVVDNFDPFYAPVEKRANLAGPLAAGGVTLVEGDISDPAVMARLPGGTYQAVVHIAALAGIRPSLNRPADYMRVNVVGTTHLLEWARQHKVPRMVFASSSSVYGNSPLSPWREDNCDLHPISPYAASKLAAEHIGETYSHLYDLTFVALRFFTVYGPRQRPDLAIRKFAAAMLEGRPITVFGDGSTARDYTYVGDIVAGITSTLTAALPRYSVINLGNTQPVELRQLISLLEQTLGCPAKIERLPMQPGDVERTCADITRAGALLGYAPGTSLETGLQHFSQWLRQHHNHP